MLIKLANFVKTHLPILVLVILGLLIMYVKKYTPYFGEFFYPSSLIGMDSHISGLSIFSKSTIYNFLSTSFSAYLYDYALPYNLVAILPKMLYFLKFGPVWVIRIEFITLIFLSYFLIYSLFKKIFPKNSSKIIVFFTITLLTSSLIWGDNIYRWNNFMSTAIIPVGIILLLLEGRRASLFIKIIKIVLIILLLFITTTNFPLFVWTVMGVLFFLIFVKTNFKNLHVNYFNFVIAVATIVIFYYLPLFFSIIGSSSVLQGSASFSSFIMPVFKTYPYLFNYLFPKTWQISSLVWLPNIILIASLAYYLYLVIKRKTKINIWILLLIFIPLIFEILSSIIPPINTKSQFLNLPFIFFYQPFRKAGGFILLGFIAILIQTIPLWREKYKTLYTITAVIFVLLFVFYSPLFNHDYVLKNNSDNSQLEIDDLKQVVEYVNQNYKNQKIIFFPVRGRMRNISSGDKQNGLVVLDGELAQAFRSKVLIDSPNYNIGKQAFKSLNTLAYVNSFQELKEKCLNMGIGVVVIFKGPYTSYFNDFYLPSIAVKFLSQGYYDVNKSFAIFDFSKDNSNEKFEDIDLSNIGNSGDIKVLNNLRLSFNPDSRTMSPNYVQQEANIDFQIQNEKIRSIDLLNYASYSNSWLGVYKYNEANNNWDLIDKINGRRHDLRT